MNNNKFVVILLVFFCFSSRAFSAAAGTTIFDFLKLPKNAVQAALASMTTFGKNTYMPNQATLGLINKYNASVTHASHFQDVAYNTFYFTAPLKCATFSISYYGLDYGKFDKTREADDGDFIKDGTFNAGDSCVQLNAGRRVLKDLCVGAGVKYIWNNIYGSTLSGAAIDLATLYISKSSWTVAGGLENLGLKVEGYNLPGSFHISYRNSLSDSFDLGLEFNTFFDGIMQLKGAFEINRDKMFFLRGGYRYPLNNDNKSLGEWYKRNLSLGFGINIKETVAIDYAWLPFGELGNTSIFSLRVEFK